MLFLAFFKILIIKEKLKTLYSIWHKFHNAGGSVFEVLKWNNSRQMLVITYSELAEQLNFLT